MYDIKDILEVRLISTVYESSADEAKILDYQVMLGHQALHILYLSCI